MNFQNQNCSRLHKTIAVCAKLAENAIRFHSRQVLTPRLGPRVLLPVQEYDNLL